MVVAIGVSFGCSAAEPDSRILTQRLLVDVEFDAEQLQSVQDAVDLWTEATGGRFAPQIELGTVECGDAFAIEAVQTPDCFVGQKVETSDGRVGHVRAATNPEEHSVAVATWLAGSGFRDTVAHELGHYLLLGHGPGIMAQHRSEGTSEVGVASVSEFCDIWGC